MSGANSAILVRVDSPPSNTPEDETGAAGDSVSTGAPREPPPPSQRSNMCAVRPPSTPLSPPQRPDESPSLVTDAQTVCPELSPPTLAAPLPVLPARLVPSGPPTRISQPSKWPVRLAVIFGVIAFICVGLGAIAFRYYDNATQPDRRTPDVAVDNYLQAFLVDRDDHDAAQYSCVGISSQPPLAAFRDAVDAKERQLNAPIGMTWVETKVDKLTSNSATVDATLTQETNAGGIAQKLSSSWVFDVRNSDGWRVCGATRING